jgi:hypothetical protein
MVDADLNALDHSWGTDTSSPASADTATLRRNTMRLLA